MVAREDLYDRISHVKSFILFILVQAVVFPCFSAQKVFTEKIEDLWQIVEVVMSDYPVKLNDMDKRIFETSFTSGKKMWKEPQPEKSYIGYSTKIIIRLLKSKKREAYKMIIKKVIRQKPNFFDDYKYIDSDGIEEKVILYRVNREFKIKKLQDKAMEKPDNSSDDASEDPWLEDST